MERTARARAKADGSLGIILITQSHGFSTSSLQNVHFNLRSRLVLFLVVFHPDLLVNRVVYDRNSLLGQANYIHSLAQSWERAGGTYYNLI